MALVKLNRLGGPCTGAGVSVATGAVVEVPEEIGNLWLAREPEGWGPIDWIPLAADAVLAQDDAVVQHRELTRIETDARAESARRAPEVVTDN